MLTLIFKYGLVVSILVGMASVVGGVWAATRPPVLNLLGTGLPIGNKQLIAYQHGADFRLATRAQVEVILSPVYVPTAEHRAAWAWNERWGGPCHWLDVPTLDVSLWWPFGLSLVLPGICLLNCVRSRPRVGFPIMAAPRAT